MFRQILLLIFGLLLISGCARYITIKPEKAFKFRESKVTKIKLPMKLAGILLASGDTLYFNEAGGFYYPKKTHLLDGITENGEEFSEGLFVAKKVIFHSTFKGQILARYLSTFDLAEQSKEWQMNQDSSVIIGDMYFDFDKNMGLIDSKKNQVYGKLKDYDSIRVSIDEISKLTVDRFKIGEKKYEAGVHMGPILLEVDWEPSLELLRSDMDKSAHFGIFLTKKYTKNIRLQAEINFYNYSFESFRAVTFTNGITDIEMSIERKMKISFLEMPLIAKFDLSREHKINPSIYAGAAIIFGISSKDEFDSTSIIRTTPDDIYFNNSGSWKIANIRQPSTNLIIGGELTYNLNTFDVFVGVRYRYQLTNPLKPMMYYEAKAYHRPMANEAGEPDELLLDYFSVSFGVKYSF